MADLTFRTESVKAPCLLAIAVPREAGETPSRGGETAEGAVEQ